MTVYARPGAEGSLMSFQPRYDNYIGGQWVAPVQGRYFENLSPVTGEVFCEVARSDEADIEKALDAAHAAAPAWGKTSPAERAVILNKVADRIEENLESIAVAASWDNGKPVRETLNADIPLVVDHFRYFAGAIRAQEGSLSQIDEDTVAYHFHEPLGVVGLIVPWNFPILMATWKLAPALAAGNAVVLKPAEQTPASILYVMSLVGDLLPAGVLNIVNGFGVEAGKPLASSNRIAKIAFTGETTTGRLIMQYASQNLIPVTLELGGKSPNIFFSDVLAAHDDYQDKALEGFTMFALNQGEVCTCPSRSLVQADIYDEFLELAAIRTKAVRQGDPLDTETMIGAQASNDQLEKILSYIEIGKDEGARVVTGGERAELPGQQQDADLPGGDLRPGGVGDLVHRLRRRHLDRQRHPLRAGCRGVEPRRQYRLSGRARYPGRPGVDQLLPRLPRARGVRRLQAVGHRPGEPQDDARPLPADQEPARLLQR
jgi:aldehyde dehydrogenase